MKNETKTGLTSEAKLTIPNCDYWGKYNGYKIYKCYSKTAPDYPNLVFAIGTNLYMNGEVIGKVDSVGQVSGWNPDRAVKKTNKPEFEPVAFDSSYDDNTVSSAEELLELALKRSIKDLTGPSLANW